MHKKESYSSKGTEPLPDALPVSEEQPIQSPLKEMTFISMEQGVSNAYPETERDRQIEVTLNLTNKVL